MIENRGKKQGFAPRTGNEKNPKAQKKRSRKTKFFEINRFERATRAKKKGIYLPTNGYSGAPKTHFFYFLVLIWPARSARKMFKRQGFCRSWVSLRRRRGQQAVFREQFLAHLFCFLLLIWPARSGRKIFTPLRVGWPPTPQVYFGP